MALSSLDLNIHELLHVEFGIIISSQPTSVVPDDDKLAHRPKESCVLEVMI
jgi:hypothetical protein